VVQQRRHIQREKVRTTDQCVLVDRLTDVLMDVLTDVLIDTLTDVLMFLVGGWCSGDAISNVKYKPQTNVCWLIY
jgi:hypothetical protein